jgi:sulfur-oxidizing protein SoxZ
LARALINVPKSAKRGDVVEIRTMISHPMETGYRPDESGALRPRDILRKLVVSFEGEEIFRAELFPAMAANPFIAFTTVASKSGTLTFSWTGDNGFTQTETASIIVT